MDAVFSTTTRDQSALRPRIKGMGGEGPSAPTSKPPTASFKSSKGVYSAPTGQNGSNLTGFGNTKYTPKARPGSLFHLVIQVNDCFVLSLQTNSKLTKTLENITQPF